MPVYNAEATLAASLQSVIEQSFRDIEMIFVDDCSSDGTAGLLADFAAKSGIPCSILRQEKNMGVASARKRGIEAASGEYIGFLDADDRLETEALKKAAAALEVSDEPVDILGWDWTLGFTKNGRLMRQAGFGTPLQAVMNLMGGTMRWNLWLFLIRREMLVSNGISFIDGADMGEDMQFMIRSFLAAARVKQIHESLYRYNAVSESSISRQFSQQRRSQIESNVKEVEKAVKTSEHSDVLCPEMDSLKLFLKRPLLIGNEKKNYELWYGWFPESNGAAMKNKALPLRIRLLQGMAARKMWTGVRMHYRLIYQFVYGILYH